MSKVGKGEAEQEEEKAHAPAGQERTEQERGDDLKEKSYDPLWHLFMALEARDVSQRDPDFARRLLATLKSKEASLTEKARGQLNPFLELREKEKH